MPAMLDGFIAAGALPNLASLRSESVVYLTDAAEPQRRFNRQIGRRVRWRRSALLDRFRGDVFRPVMRCERSTLAAYDARSSTSASCWAAAPTLLALLSAPASSTTTTPATERVNESVPR